MNPSLSLKVCEVCGDSAERYYVSGFQCHKSECANILQFKYSKVYLKGYLEANNIGYKLFSIQDKLKEDCKLWEINNA